jgi:hypothetical protein
MVSLMYLMRYKFQSSNHFFGLKIEKSECSMMLFSSLFMQLNYIVNQSTCCATKFAFDVCNNGDFFFECQIIYIALVRIQDVKFFTIYATQLQY